MRPASPTCILGLASRSMPMRLAWESRSWSSRSVLTGIGIIAAARGIHRGMCGYAALLRLTCGLPGHRRCGTQRRRDPRCAWGPRQARTGPIGAPETGPALAAADRAGPVHARRMQDLASRARHGRSLAEDLTGRPHGLTPADPGRPHSRPTRARRPCCRRAAASDSFDATACRIGQSPGACRVRSVRAP
jgi:hypothetical protein